LSSLAVPVTGTDVVTSLSAAGAVIWAVGLVVSVLSLTSIWPLRLRLVVPSLMVAVTV